MDETTRVLADPARWLADEYPGPVPTLPRFILIFDSLESRVRPWLESNGYALEARWFQSHVPVSDREGRAVLLYEISCEQTTNRG